MGMRSKLLMVAAMFCVTLPGSNQFPQNLVLQPVTHHEASKELPESDFTLLFPPKNQESTRSSESSENLLICKTIQSGEGLFRFSPFTKSNELFFIPSPMMSLGENPFLRFLVTVPSVPSAGIEIDDTHHEISEGVTVAAAPPPLLASLCVSEDSPRPFPVLFAPPPPSSFEPVESDFRKDALKPFDTGFPFSHMDLENPLKINLNIPSVGSVSLGIHGVPATVKTSSPSLEDPAGRIEVQLHTNPPGSITLGLTGEDMMARKPASLVPDYSVYRGINHLTHPLSPSVSLLFSRPVGSVGIGSTNSPAVNIEKQNIISSGEKYPESVIKKDWLSNNKGLYF